MRKLGGESHLGNPLPTSRDRCDTLRPGSLGSSPLNAMLSIVFCG